MVSFVKEYPESTIFLKQKMLLFYKKVILIKSDELQTILAFKNERNLSW